MVHDNIQYTNESKLHSKCHSKRHQVEATLKRSHELVAKSTNKSDASCPGKAPKPLQDDLGSSRLHRAQQTTAWKRQNSAAKILLHTETNTKPEQFTEHHLAAKQTRSSTPLRKPAARNNATHLIFKTTCPGARSGAAGRRARAVQVSVASPSPGIGYQSCGGA